MKVLVFDIETVPDVTAGAKLHQLEGLSAAEIAEAMFALRREKVGHDFLPHYLQKIICISSVFADGEKIKVWSLGDTASDEKELISRFFAGIDKHHPTLVSWNGTSFDLPVLHYRALLHGISAPTYWDSGEKDKDFRWNNYLNRYHYRHLDLMDVLSAYQGRAVAPLDEIASMLGFPGKMGMDGSQVWGEYLAGNLQKIRQYCETDVLNTYGVYLRFELMRGLYTQEEYDAIMEELCEYLAKETSKPHLQEFLKKMEVCRGR